MAYPKEGEQPSLVKFTSKQLSDRSEIHLDQQSLTLSDFSSAEDEDQPITFDDIPVLREKFGEKDSISSIPGVGDPSSHKAYLTGRHVSDRSPQGIHFSYDQRWALETSVNQVSNDMMPVCNSSDPKLRLYAVNIAVVFQNWLTLINRVPSPKYGLRLSISYHNMLKAIQHVAFNPDASI
ncbi:MAG: hypothetical protein ABEI86_05885, partial [Halobacteriaceae archaeon]